MGSTGSRPCVPTIRSDSPQLRISRPYRPCAAAPPPAGRATRGGQEAEALWHTPAQEPDSLIADGHYFIAEEDGRLVAGAGWEPHARIADTAVVRSVFVDPAHSALGAEAVRAAEDTAVSAGYDHLLVPAAPRATGFYRRLGYMSADADDMVLEAGVRVGYRRMWKHA
ncbi:MAG: GNAT family N-acetyltransferase [Rhodospirillaceae bacterium]|nr:GNAT family N-acetyltransferase [Rhodospirillaceae bacterium]